MVNVNFEKQTGREKYFKVMRRELKNLIDPKTGEIYRRLVKKISCPLCNSQKHQLFFKKQGFSFVRCDKCGLTFVNPQIIEKKLIKYYIKESSANKIWKDILLSLAQIKFNNKNYSIILNSIRRYKKKGKLLDIGCSIGHFLKLARDNGYEVEGLELEEEAVRYARKKFGLDVQQKILSECDFPNKHFDIVAALGVLEHVVEPLNFLKEIHRILVPGGLLALTLPNIESLACMILKEKARTFTGRNHLTYFCMRTLTDMLKRAGFKVVSGQTYVTCIDDIVNQMQFLNPFQNKQLKYLPNNFIELLKNENKKKEIEKIICQFGLGYKLRVLAQKL